MYNLCPITGANAVGPIRFNAEYNNITLIATEIWDYRFYPRDTTANVTDWALERAKPHFRCAGFSHAARAISNNAYTNSISHQTRASHNSQSRVLAAACHCCITISKRTTTLKAGITKKTCVLDHDEAVMER